MKWPIYCRRKNPWNLNELNTDCVLRAGLEILDYKKIPGPCLNVNRHCLGVQLTAPTDLSLRLFKNIKTWIFVYTGDGKE